MLRAHATPLEGVLLLEPRAFPDDRGYFLETWNAAAYAEAGLDVAFVQDNLSVSHRGVLRGLHYQNPTAQGKLVAVLAGAAYDVAVDLRVGSPTFGRWYGVELTEDNHRQLYIPEGFAHGFVALADGTRFAYKCTAPYERAAERSLRWDDPDLGIRWPVEAPRLSEKDAAAPRLADLPREALFTYAGGANRDGANRDGANRDAGSRAGHPTSAEAA